MEAVGKQFNQRDLCLGESIAAGALTQRPDCLAGFGNVYQSVVGVFLISGNPGGNISSRGRLGRQRGFCGGQKLQEHIGGQLTGLHSGLVVGVDVNQAGVEAHGALKKGNELPQRVGIHRGNGDGDVLTAAFGQRLAGAAQEALQVIPAVNSPSTFTVSVGA